MLKYIILAVAMTEMVPKEKVLPISLISEELSKSKT